MYVNKDFDINRPLYSYPYFRSETTIMKNEEIQCLVISFDDKLSSAFNVIKSE